MTFFPDIEPLLVSRIKAVVGSTVTVATKKPQPGTTPYPSKLVVVRSDGGPQLERNLMRLERVGINIYCTTYSDASALARQVDAAVRGCAGGLIKRVESALSPIRVDNESGTEQRYMTFELVVKATDV
jgi:hypothetical protein